VFKDRDKYVTGEFRFRKGYGKKNPRKMVRTWAEKELRNLTRLYNAGILCPRPMMLRSHVLLMSFLGTDGWPAPRLTDVEINASKARELYWDLALTVRKIFHECKLVHGDLSEFNLLYHEGKAYVIDVSQSVEHDHPRALEFLRKDLTNVTEFFRRKGVNVVGVRDFYDFVVDPNIAAGGEEAALEKLNKKAESMTEEERSADQIVEEEVFKNIHIARTLEEVPRPELEIVKIKTSEAESMPYQSVTGVRGRTRESDSDDDDVSESGESVSDSEEEAENVEAKKGFNDSHRPRDESPNSRNERKKAVKEEQAAKRKDKMKKHVKKRKEKGATNTKK
jgi:RIO kinase 1